MCVFFFSKLSYAWSNFVVVLIVFSMWKLHSAICYLSSRYKKLRKVWSLFVGTLYQSIGKDQIKQIKTGMRLCDWSASSVALFVVPLSSGVDEKVKTPFELPIFCRWFHPTKAWQRGRSIKLINHITPFLGLLYLILAGQQTKNFNRQAAGWFTFYG